MQDEIPTSLPHFNYHLTTLQGLESDQYKFFSMLSEQVNLWSLYNFGRQASHRPAMGMLEELAELMEAIELLDRDEILDAVADVTIYMADYYAKRGWNLGTAWSNAVRPDWVKDTQSLSQIATRLVKQLSHYHLKGEQGIRLQDKNDDLMRETCQATLWFLRNVSAAFSTDYIDSVATVWYTVSKRDWRVNRSNANVVAAQEVAAHKKALTSAAAASPAYEVLDDEEEE